MAKIIILGSSASNPLPRTETNRWKDYLDIRNYMRKFSAKGGSAAGGKLHDDELCKSAQNGGKDRRTRACLAIVNRGKVILFDAGPDIKEQLRREKIKLSSVKAVFITHNHPDASFGLRHLPKTVKIFSEKEGTIKHNKVMDVFGLKILPFRVVHSKLAPYAGYKIELRSKKLEVRSFVYISDLSSTRGLKKYVQDADILFADGSILKRDLKLHLSMLKQLRIYKQWKLKRVIFTHIGHATMKHNDLVKFLRGRYKNTDVAYDGMVVRL